MGIFEQAIAALFTAAITGLIGWVYSVTTRVTKLESERANLSNLERLMATKHESLERLIDLKFEHMQELLQHALGRVPTHGPDR